jgi:hypothetical protein
MTVHPFFGTTLDGRNCGIGTRLSYMPMSAYKEVIGLQDRHRTYNVTLRRVRVIIVAMEKQKVLRILRVCL